MEFILAFLAGAVVGSLCGFDRLIFKGKLRQLYSPEGMHCLFSANHVLRKDFESYTTGITENVLAASLEEEANKLRCFRYMPSVNTDKDTVARAFAAERKVREGLVCVLKCVEPCWTFVLNSVDKMLVIQGKERRCAHLYHYYLPGKSPTHSSLPAQRPEARQCPSSLISARPISREISHLQKRRLLRRISLIATQRGHQPIAEFKVASSGDPSSEGGYIQHEIVGKHPTRRCNSLISKHLCGEGAYPTSFFWWGTAWGFRNRHGSESLEPTWAPPGDLARRSGISL